MAQIYIDYHIEDLTAQLFDSKTLSDAEIMELCEKIAEAWSYTI